MWGACRVVSRICAFTVMKAFSRAKAGIADQGSRTLSAEASLLSTRLADKKQLRRREEILVWGIHDGITRLSKDLRRMWLFVVPSFE